METVTDFIFLGSQITADGDFSHEIKTLASWKKSYDQPRQHIKKQRHYKGKGEKQRYTHLKAEFQRIARRNKKAFFSDQSKK